MTHEPRRPVRPEGFANTPEPPYYAVIFTSRQTDDTAGYDKMAARIAELTATQPGCLGLETTRGADGFGVTICYWRDEESVVAWKQKAEHLAAQRMGVERWYAHYELRVAKVERAYSGPEGRQP